jgi:hypothetical protein
VFVDFLQFFSDALQLVDFSPFAWFIVAVIVARHFATLAFVSMFNAYFIRKRNSVQNETFIPEESPSCFY